MRVAVDAYLGFAVEYLHKCVVIGSVFGKSLTFVEGKQSDITYAVFGNLFADDSSCLLYTSDAADEL